MDETAVQFRSPASFNQQGGRQTRRSKFPHLGWPPACPPSGEEWDRCTAQIINIIMAGCIMAPARVNLPERAPCIGRPRGGEDRVATRHACGMAGRPLPAASVGSVTKAIGLIGLAAPLRAHMHGPAGAGRGHLVVGHGNTEGQGVLSPFGPFFPLVRLERKRKNPAASPIAIP